MHAVVLVRVREVYVTKGHITRLAYVDARAYAILKVFGAAHIEQTLVIPLPTAVFVENRDLEERIMSWSSAQIYGMIVHAKTKIIERSAIHVWYVCAARVGVAPAV